MPGAGTGAGAIGPFLRKAGRRRLLRRGLQALLLSVAANYLLLAATRLASRALQRELPELATGLFVALVLLAVAALRARPSLVAREADRALGLKDRLASFLDLASRPDVDERYRAAQAAETAAALATADPRRAVAVPRWLWAAPPLFLWMIYASYFAFFVPQPLRWVRQLRMVVSGGSGGAPAEDSSPVKIVTTGGEPGKSPDEAGSPKAAPDSARDAAPQAPPPQRAQPNGETPPAAPSAETAGRDAAGPQKGNGVAGGPVNMPRPARLFSAPVGAARTPVGEDAGGRDAAGRPAAAVPRGRVAFNLVPGRGAGSGPLGPGSGQGTGQEEGLRITVDFTALSPEVRENVRRYFDELSALFTGGSLGTR